MRRYNIHVGVPTAGRFELIKENLNPIGIQEEDYWNECFTWVELKVIVPHLRALRWKVMISPLDENELPGKIHLFPFTYGVNRLVRLLTVSGLRLVLTSDSGSLRSPKRNIILSDSDR